MPTIRSCLEHRHSYVRRNAVMAIFTIYKNFDFLIPDAPELIANFLDGEQVSCMIFRQCFFLQLMKKVKCIFQHLFFFSKNMINTYLKLIIRVAYREFLVNIYNIFVKDMSCKRNAFMMLIHADQERALSFLSGCMDQVSLEQHTYRPDQGPSSFIKVILIIINH